LPFLLFPLIESIECLSQALIYIEIEIVSAF
jgi:hypothetical protein